MNAFLALVRRETATLFLSPALHAAAGVFTLLYGLAFYLNAVQENTATLEPAALFVAFLSIFLAPLLTMRSFAEESSTGTIELLMTAPVRPVAVVLAKFAGAFAFYCATLVPCLAYAGLLAFFGDVDGNTILTTLLGLALLGAVYLSIGLFASSLTESQIVAAAGACGASVVVLLLSAFAGRDGALGWLGLLSFVPPFQTTFLRGVLDTRAIAYFVTVPAGMLFFCWLALRARAVVAPSRGPVRRAWSLAGGLAGLAAAECLLLGAAAWHTSGAGTPTRPQGILFAAAVLLGLAAAECLRRARSGGSGVGRVLRSGLGPLLLAGLSVFVILVNFNAYAHLAWKRWDFSEGRVNSLSTDARRTLDELADRVDVLVFYSDKVDYDGVPLLRRTKDLLTEFASYSPRIHVQYVDAVGNPDRAGELARECQLDLQALPQTALLSYAGRRAIVPAPYLLRPPDAQSRLGGNKTPVYQGELVFTLALRRLLDPNPVKIYWAIGHGELLPQGAEAKPGSAGQLAAQLKQDGFELEPLLLKGQEVPPDAGALILAGPVLPLGPTLDAIRRYVERGGRLAVFLPSAAPARGIESDAALSAQLKEWGGEPQDTVLFDPQNNDAGVETTILAVASDSHPVSEGGRNVVCLLPHARSILENPKAEAGGWTTERLLVSAETARGIRRADLKDKGARGPFTVAFAAAHPPGTQAGESRLIVCGSADMIANLNADKGHNLAWARSAIAWVAGKDYRIRVDPPDYPDRALKLTGGQQRLLGWVSLVGLPQLWLLLAAAVWWMRRE